MTDDDRKLLEKNGWMVECESPLEISKTEECECMGFASQEAAQIVIFYLRDQQREATSNSGPDLND